MSIAALQESGIECDFREFPSWFLANYCGITLIKAKDLDAHTASRSPALGAWGREAEKEGWLISQLPIFRGPQTVGIQFRAFRPDGASLDRIRQIRSFGSEEGLYLPYFIGANPKAVVIHEGPWGAVAATLESKEFQDLDLFSVATLSASVSANTIKATLDVVANEVVQP